MACETCKGHEKNAPNNVPYIVHESSMARMERQVKRLWIAVLVAVSMAVCGMLAIHAGWLYYESQFETIEYSYDYQQDGEGTNIIGNGNDVNNGSTTEGQN